METKELIGPPLDWAVARALHRNWGGNVNTNWAATSRWHPSTDWSQGGLIIEQELIGIVHFPDGWQAQNWQGIPNTQGGPSALIAAMRCYVASKLGDDVHIPEALL